MSVKNVDMETSAFQVVCWIHKIPSLSIGIVTDRPIDDVGESFKGTIPHLVQNRKMLSKLLYKIVSSLIFLDMPKTKRNINPPADIRRK
jgi:nucleoside phosphorylase